MQPIQKYALAHLIPCFFVVPAWAATDATNFTAANGQTVSVSIPTFTTTADPATWQAAGAGSRLLFPNLVAITPSASDLLLQAIDGGDVEFPMLTNFNRDNFTFQLQSFGAGSVINVSQLNLTIYNTDISINGGAVNWGIPHTLFDCSITMDTGGTLNLSTITSLQGDTQITALNGAQMSISATTFGGSTTILNATGVGSRITFPKINSIIAGGWLTFSATAGGVIDIPNATRSLTDGITLQVGGGSLINMPNIGPIIGGAQVSINNGTVQWGNPTTVRFSNITIDAGGTLNLASTTNADGTSFDALNGATITLPKVTSYSVPWYVGTVLQARGANSQLALPAVTSFSVAGHGPFSNTMTVSASGPSASVILDALTSVVCDTAGINFQANAGGLIEANELTTISNVQGSLNGQISTFSAGGGDVEMPSLSTVTSNGQGTENFVVRSDGIGSRVNLASLRDTTTFNNQFVLADGGEIDLGGFNAPFIATFTANFDANFAGTLDIYLNNELIESLSADEPGVDELYQIPFPASGTVEFFANGSGRVTLQNYSVPEPAALPWMAAALLAVRRKRRRVACMPPG